MMPSSHGIIWRSRAQRSSRFRAVILRCEPTGPREARPDDKLREPRRMIGHEPGRRPSRPATRAPQGDGERVQRIRMLSGLPGRCAVAVLTGFSEAFLTVRTGVAAGAGAA